MDKHSIQPPTPSQPDIDVRESTANELAAQREAEAERERRRREEEQKKTPGYLR